MVKVGDYICIDWMDGEPNYRGREGYVRSIDDIGQLHGSWGGLAVIPGKDLYHVTKEGSSESDENV